MFALFLLSLSLAHFSGAAEDFSFCHDIQFKHDANENCTDGGKYPILGNCTHFYKCDGMPSGALLHEAFTDCPQGQFYDHKTSNCIQGTPAQIETCDQRTCQTFLEAEGVEKLEDGPRYPSQGQGQGQGQQYPPRPNQGNPQGPYPQTPQQRPGQAGYGNQGDVHYGQPGQGHEDGQHQGGKERPYPEEKERPYPEEKDRKDQQGKPREDKKEPHKDGHAHKNGCPIPSSTISLLIVSIFLTSVRHR